MTKHPSARREAAPMMIDLDPGDRYSLARWTTAVDRLYPPLTVAPQGAASMRGRIRAARTRELQLVEMSGGPHHVERKAGRPDRSDGDYYKLSVQVAGHGSMRQAGRDLALDPGSISFYDMGLSYDVSYDTEFRIVVALFPKRALSLPRGVVGELTAHPLSVEHGMGAVTSSLARSLADNLGLLAGASGPQVGRTFLDLVSAFVGEQLEIGTDGSAAGTAMLGRILRFIGENLADPDLDPPRIAAAHYMSTRQLYNVFAPTGVSVAQWIKQRRLEGARRELADPLRRDERVADIAARWGFADGAYFGRVFRERFGMTPGQWRDRYRESEP